MFTTFKQFTQDTNQPVSPNVGDEWYNPTVSILYKYIAYNGLPQWLAMPSFGRVSTPTWSNVDRPTRPVLGQIGFNTDTLRFEVYNNTAWLSFSPSQPPTLVTYLVVGGGGGSSSGGGGGGGFRTGPAVNIVPGTTYTITVGAGGTQGVTGVASLIVGGSVGTFASPGIVAAGGGAGGINANGVVNGSPGGSGGGGAGSGFGGSYTGGAGNTPSTNPQQGNNGGNGTFFGASNGGGSGGGGGAGAVGESGGGTNNNTGGNGGAGATSFLTGSAVTYAGGGGGSSRSGTAPTGGAGGGGNGSISAAGTAGTANTGGGGGATNAAGGSGVVIIAYPNAHSLASSTTGSPTVGNVAGTRTYRFTGNGSITF